jgi:DNA-binding MarR family transcriptional regulator
MQEKVQQPEQIPAPSTALAPDPRKVLRTLGPRTEQCLLFIWNYYRENMLYPTHREVCEAMGVQSNTAAMFFRPLEKKGYLERVHGEQRNIRLTKLALEKLERMGVNIQEGLAAA